MWLGIREAGGYIEGCWHFYREHIEPFPGMVVGTGVRGNILSMRGK